MICYYKTKEEKNLPPSSRLEISSCNRTTSFHHTPLLYWVPSAKRNPLFYFTKQNSLEVLKYTKKATYAAKVYYSYIEQVSCFLTKYNSASNEFLVSVFLSTFRTNPEEIELMSYNFISAQFFCIFNKSKAVQIVQVINATTAHTLDMMMNTGISIITHTVLASVQNLNHINLLQNFYGLINSSEAHGRIVRLQSAKEHLCSGMTFSCSQGFINRQTLGRNLVTVGTQDVAQLLTVQHTDTSFIDYYNILIIFIIYFSVLFIFLQSIIITGIDFLL